MAGVRLEFTQRGHFDYFNIYRNSVSTEIVDLDQPLATCNTMYYVDLTVIQSQKYYYRIGIVRGNEEVFSDELIVSTSAMKSYRYLRIYITANNGSFYLAINEIEMFTAGSNIDETNPTQAETAASASQFSTIDDSRAFKAFDNNFGLLNNWVVGTDYAGQYEAVRYPAWIAYNFGVVKDIDRIKIYPQPRSDIVDRAPKDFIIQGSDDNLTWNDIKAFNDVTGWIAGTGKTFNLVTGIVT